MQTEAIFGQFNKTTFVFAGDDREQFRDAPCGAERTIEANSNDGLIRIKFRVKRNVCLGERQRWIYGEVLEPNDGAYYQIEIKLYKDNPRLDSIEVFPDAPPLNAKRPRHE